MRLLAVLKSLFLFSLWNIHRATHTHTHTDDFFTTGQMDKNVWMFYTKNNTLVSYKSYSKIKDQSMFDESFQDTLPITYMDT